jgi:hypothetical protein
MLTHHEIRRHFKRTDPVIAEVIKRVGPFYGEVPGQS